MGFGILFVGYILAFFMMLVTYGYFFELLGVLLMLYAFTKLSDYNANFKLAFIATLPLLLLSLATTGLNVSGFFGYDFSKSIFTTVVIPYCRIAFNLVFHGALFYAVGDIARETECNGIKASAYRNAVVYAMYFVLQLIVYIPAVSANETLFTSLGMCGNVLWLCWVALDAVMLFSCYMKICDESDEEMKAKPSKIGFVNKLRDDFDSKEKRAREADVRYRRERAERKKKRKK